MNKILIFLILFQQINQTNAYVYRWSVTSDITFPEVLLLIVWWLAIWYILMIIWEKLEIQSLKNLWSNIMAFIWISVILSSLLIIQIFMEWIW